MKREVSWSAVLVVAAAVGVIGFSGYLVGTWPPEPPDSTLAISNDPSPAAATAPATSPSPSPSPAAERRVVAVLGGSFSAEDPDQAAPSWPTIVADDLGWTVQNESVDGSGYVAGNSFDKRVQQVVDAQPDVIVVAGGERDLGRPIPEVTSAAEDLISQLTTDAPGARIIVLSPFSKGEPGPLTTQLASDLRDIAQANQVEYVDATRWLLGEGTFVAPDGVHPTQEGQQRIAQRLEEALTRLGVAEQTGG